MIILQTNFIQSMGINISEGNGTNKRRTKIFHFGNIEVVMDKNNHSQYFEQIYDFMLGPEIEQQSIDELRERNNQCPHLIQIKKIQLENSSICSNSTKLHVTFEYIPCTLQKFIDKGHNFTQKQVVRLLTCLLEAIKYLNSNDSYHGDISPDYIYIDCKNNQEPIYKIFDSAYFQPIRNGRFLQYQGYYRAQKEKIFCAPEVLMNLGQKRLYPIYNHFIADTFSIGLVALYCMTLINPLGAYTHKNQIDSYFIQSMFRIAYRKMYSQNLINIIRSCLQFRNRPCAQEILEGHSLFFQSFRQTFYQFSTAKTSLRRSRVQIQNRIFNQQQ